MPKADRRQRPLRTNQKIESLEDRLAMTADPIGGLLGGAVTQHAIEDEAPQHVSHHGVNDEAPPVLHHGAINDAPPMMHHGAIVEDAPLNLHSVIDAAPPLSQHGAANDLPPLSHHGEQAPDFWLDPVSDTVDVLEGALGEIEQTLSSAHGTTGWNDVRANYGFRGGGQTVAVIDSGIAYDHYALGGGFGSNYRVVGGWDFTGENDADPYDDGPEGSHGTHVAGIIGSSDATHQGVAPDVDLVGLRVFDDAGNGYFSWVENALDWVYANRNAYENPITAVNLSLGTNWNSDSVPSWAMLEDEFQQLEQAGIFISVSAGNSFTSYNEPGLSYPAASPYVVPVMSMDDSGTLSYYSQRHQSAIAAPGRYIYSTIPDYAGNNNGVTDDWANFSGTSMAAPYVAGSSVLIREAMEFVGYASIDQDTIYNHMLATADTISDSATGLDYSRLNLGAAIDALMPTDDYGSSEATAYDLGTLTGGVSQSSLMEMSGVISTLDDGDFFTFTAGSTGTVTFALSGTTHNLDASWQGFGGEGWTENGGLSYTMNVVAGQDYTIALSSSDGLGYYDLSIDAESTFEFTDWGPVAGQHTHTGLTAGGEAWYRVAASQSGYLTTEAIYGSGAVSFELYDANQNFIAAATGDRIDYLAQAGEELFLRVEGSASDLDIRLTNLVNASGDVVSVSGTSGADTITFAAGDDNHVVTIGGVAYSFDAAVYDTINLDGGAGVDSITMTGTAGSETATLRAGQADLTSSEYSATATGVENIVVNSGGGGGYAYLFDTAGDERLTATPESARLAADDGSFDNEAVGFERVYAYASGGFDDAILYDGATDDYFRGTESFSVLRGQSYEFLNYASGFDRTYAYASDGADMAVLEGNSGDDYFRATPDFAVMRGQDYSHFNYTDGFESVYAYGGTGYDQAYLEDSTADDRFSANPFSASMRAHDYAYYNSAAEFEFVSATASLGFDQALLYDGATDDIFDADPSTAILRDTGGTFHNQANGFDRTYAYSSGGFDQALLYDGATNDYFRGNATFAVLRGQAYEFFNYAQGFDRTYAYASSGYDTALLEDGATNDYFRGTSTFSVLRGMGYEFFNYAQGFDRVDAFASLGSDVAYLYDTDGDEDLTVRQSSFELAGDDFANNADGFDYGYAYGTAGGTNTADEEESLDFVFGKFGVWS